jgi:hypothetical protein
MQELIHYRLESGEYEHFVSKKRSPSNRAQRTKLQLPETGSNDIDYISVICGDYPIK